MIKLGIIGYGQRINMLLREAFRQILPDIKVVGIIDPAKETIISYMPECDKTAPFFDSLDSLMVKAKPDALVIGTTCNLHTPYAIEASKYNLPLFLEKPVSTSMEQTIMLEKAFEKSKSEVVVSFPMRVSQICRMAKQKIDEGLLGCFEHFSAINYPMYGHCYFEKPYNNYEIIQGLFIQKATHDLDYIRYLIGSKVVRVAAMQTKGRIFGGSKRKGLNCSECDEQDTCIESPINRKINNSSPEYRCVDHSCLFSEDCGNLIKGINEESSTVIVQFENGTHGVYTQAFFKRRDAQKRGAFISGYKGTVEIDFCSEKLRCIHHHKPFTEDIDVKVNTSHFGGDMELARNFLNVIKGVEKSKSTISDGIQSIYICLAAKESAEKGVFVNVRQVGAGN